MSAKEVVVATWPKPRGYANGRVGQGAVVHVAGQIGWDEHGRFVDGGLVPQFGKALDNVISVVRAAGGVPEDIATMTVFVTDIEEYRKSQAMLAPIWRERLGRHYPAMALVAVTALVEPAASVEIQAVAYVGAA
ncbi:MAG TPA: RidA family protein [Kofleriaceae bacterium]|nr:RidA family protein [Kofleriaceae bacterium]